MALCYQIGFAVERNEVRSKEILKESEFAELDLSLLRAKNTKSPHSDSEWLTLQQLPAEGFLNEQDIEESIFQLTQEAKGLSQSLGDGHTLTLNVRNQLAYILGNQGRYNEFEKVNQQIMDASLTTLGPESLHALGSMGNLSAMYAENGRLDEAGKIMIQVIETLDKQYNPQVTAQSDITETLRYEQNPYLLTCMNNLAFIRTSQERWQEAENLQKTAFDIALGTLGADNTRTLESILNIAATYFSLSRLDEAEELYLEVLKSNSKVLSAQHPFRLAVEANLALTYSRQGRHEKATQLGMQTLNARLKLFGPAHKDTLISMDHMARIFRKSKQWERAKELCVQLIETKSQILGAEHISTLDAMAKLMALYFDQEHWTEAERLALQVVEARRKQLGAENIATLHAVEDLADVYTKQERWEEAIELYVLVVDIRKRLLGAEHHNTLACMSNLVLLYISCGQERLVEAEQLALQIKETSIRILGSSNPDTLTSMANLAEVYQKQGRQEEALNLTDSIEQLKSIADHPETSLCKTAPGALKTGPLRWQIASSTIEYVRRTRESTRSQENGLPLKPL